MHLTVQVEKGKDESTVVLKGEIDIYTLDKIESELIPLTKKKGHTVIVNLQGVNYMDSTGLGLFIKSLKTSTKYESHLILVQLQERIARLFKITGLDEIFQIESSAGCQ